MHEYNKGLEDWNPYETPEAPTGLAPPAQDRRRHSGIGITSLVIGMLTGVGEFGLFMAAGIMESSNPGGIDETSGVAIALGLAMIGGMMLSFLGMALGLAAVLQKDRLRVFGALGLLINGMILFGAIGIIGLGLLLG